MADEHQIKHTLDGFAVSDPFGETTVFSTKAEAKDIESAMQNGRRFGAAKMLVETAIQEHVKMCCVDRKTAKYWIASAMEVTT
jgi:hypothetical protein